MTIARTLLDRLTRDDIDYGVVEHMHSFTSSESARKSGISDGQLAKAVLLEDEQGCVMAVVPASHKVELDMVNQRLHRRVGLAGEDRVAGTFTDCEDAGAIPPLGMAYGVQTMVDTRLFDEDDIYFEAGDHEELIHVSTPTFRRLMTGAETGHFSTRR